MFLTAAQRTRCEHREPVTGEPKGRYQETCGPESEHPKPPKVNLHSNIGSPQQGAQYWLIYRVLATRGGQAGVD
jgi:hypothetical protein